MKEPEPNSIAAVVSTLRLLVVVEGYGLQPVRTGLAKPAAFKGRKKP
jgi:hypothetical protein